MPATSDNNKLLFQAKQPSQANKFRIIINKVNNAVNDILYCSKIMLIDSLHWLKLLSNPYYHVIKLSIIKLFRKLLHHSVSYVTGSGQLN